MGGTGVDTHNSKSVENSKACSFLQKSHDSLALVLVLSLSSQYNGSLPLDPSNLPPVLQAGLGGSKEICFAY